MLGRMAISLSPTRIALLVSSALGYSRNVLRGIKSYASPDRNWVAHYADPLVTPLETVAAFRPSGIIAALSKADALESIAKLGVPVVNVSSALSDNRFIRVSLDNRAIGEMVAKYFLDRGFKRFGYIGLAGREYSNQRELGFRRTLQSAGKDVLSYNDPSNRSDQRVTRSWSNLDEPMRQWIAKLGRPVAVMTCNDWQGMQLSEMCRYAGLRVPEDVAIVGVDNDDLICDLCNPPLSSVAVPGERVGYEAAMLLDRMLQGNKPTESVVTLPPIGVVTRRSSDTLAIEDSDVAAAVRFIRLNAHRPMGVEDILEDVHISRRSLERRFRQLLGRSPLEEIRRAHVERAQSLLAGTDLSMPAVAKKSGFVSAERLSVIFRQETTLTPTSYRRQFRLHDMDGE